MVLEIFPDGAFGSLNWNLISPVAPKLSIEWQMKIHNYLSSVRIVHQLRMDDALRYSFCTENVEKVRIQTTEVISNYNNNRCRFISHFSGTGNIVLCYEQLSDMNKMPPMLNERFDEQIQNVFCLHISASICMPRNYHSSDPRRLGFAPSCFRER